MRLVLLDKNCTRQNGILGEPRRLEKWFAYLATLTRKTNSAVVEQLGLVHQWRSSSGPKRSVLAFLTKVRDSKKWFYRRTNGYSTGQCCSPLRTARARNRFPALVRSSVEPILESRILVKNAKTLLFWAAAAPPLVPCQ